MKFGPGVFPELSIQAFSREAGIIHTAADGPEHGPSVADLKSGASPLHHFPSMAICLQVIFKPRLHLT